MNQVPVDVYFINGNTPLSASKLDRELGTIRLQFNNSRNQLLHEPPALSGNLCEWTIHALDHSRPRRFFHMFCEAAAFGRTLTPAAQPR